MGQRTVLTRNELQLMLLLACDDERVTNVILELDREEPGGWRVGAFKYVGPGDDDADAREKLLAIQAELQRMYGLAS